MNRLHVRRLRVEHLERRDVLAAVAFDWVPALNAFPAPVVGNDFAQLAAETPTPQPIDTKPEPREPRVQPWPTGGSQPPNPSDSLLPGTYLTANLTAASGSTTGFASYQTTTTSTIQSAAFRVTVQAATPNSSLLVVVDNAIVGELQTDGTGYGTLLLTSDLHSSLDAPPPVHEGSTISVGPLAGAFHADPRVAS